MGTCQACFPTSGFGGCRAFDGTYNARDDLLFTSIAMRTLDCSRVSPPPNHAATRAM